MSFLIPAKAAEEATAFPPGTGRYPVVLEELKDLNKTDRNGANRYQLIFRFPNGGRASGFFSSPFDAEGELVPSIARMDEKNQRNKVNFYVEQIKQVAYAAGFDDDYMNTNGIPSEHLLGRTAYIEWLGRPEDTPEGFKAYGDIKDWITKATFDQREAAGIDVVDTRTFEWRTNNTTSSSSVSETKRELPPPPGKSGGRLPPPPGR